MDAEQLRVNISIHDIDLFPWNTTPDSKVHGANMGPIWGRQDPGGPHVDTMDFVIWDWIQEPRRKWQIYGWHRNDKI